MHSKDLQKVLNRLAVENEWDIFFRLGRMINIPEIEQKIVPEINKISRNVWFADEAGDSSVTEEKIPIKFLFLVLV